MLDLLKRTPQKARFSMVNPPESDGDDHGEMDGYRCSPFPAGVSGTLGNELQTHARVVLASVDHLGWQQR